MSEVGDLDNRRRVGYAKQVFKPIWDPWATWEDCA